MMFIYGKVRHPNYWGRHLRGRHPQTLWTWFRHTVIGARTTSVLKDLEHRNACVGLADNNLELAGNGNPELQATAIRSRFSG